MIFKEKLVISIPLAHYGVVDGLINYVRDVERDRFDDDCDERDENGNLWWHADVNVGNDEEGNEYPLVVTAHGLVDNKGDATTERLWVSVDSDYGYDFKVESGIRVIECV